MQSENLDALCIDIEMLVIVPECWWSGKRTGWIEASTVFHFASNKHSLQSILVQSMLRLCHKQSDLINAVKLYLAVSRGSEAKGSCY